jgi:spore germination cell wall hydrolase CwlJ-like protein
MSKFDKVLFAAMTIVFVLAFVAVANKAFASDENGDRFCLAQNVYFESGNQPFSGKLAVANVTLNRVLDTQFPNTICDVVYQSKGWKESWITGEMIPKRGMCQFSWFCDGKADHPKDSVTWLESIRIADLVLGSEQYLDITDGALYYHADYIYPYWADHLERLVVIENHIFYK